MLNHTFIFSPGLWTGEGKIVLNMVEEELYFGTHWSVQDPDFSGKVACAQEIHIQGFPENMRNELSFYGFQGKHFSVDMENQNVGRIIGTGIVDENTISWEFRGNANFEGFETYHKQEDGSYTMRGEYITTDQFRTQIEARLWLQSKELPPPEGPQNGEDL